MAKILYLGDSDSNSTSAHRAYALIRLGHDVIFEDPYKSVNNHLSSYLIGAIHYRTGYRLIQPRLVHWLQIVRSNLTGIDVVWVDGGELLGRNCIKELKLLKCPIILYNVDDPTGKRDGNRFDSLLDAITLYDMIVVVRNETKVECEILGARKVIRVLRSYDEVAHHPFSKRTDIPTEYISDVAFIGTWMRHEERDRFLVELNNSGISVSIWGNRWQKSRFWKELSSSYKGSALGGREYVAAIQGSKICLGLLSKGNRDLHTTRSMEIPYAGGLLCGERTVEHLQIYEDNSEAVFWSDVKECAIKCNNLLSDDIFRENVRNNGMIKVRSLGLGNERVCQGILQEVNISVTF